MNKPLLVFDMDGVLTDSEPLINEAAVAMFREHGLIVRPEDFLPFVGTGENRYRVVENWGTLPPGWEPRMSTKVCASRRYFGSRVVRYNSAAPMMFDGLKQKCANSLGRGRNTVHR
mgnify:CR=1 FL=1